MKYRIADGPAGRVEGIVTDVLPHGFPAVLVKIDRVSYMVHRYGLLGNGGPGLVRLAPPTVGQHIIAEVGTTDAGDSFLWSYVVVDGEQD